METYRNLPRPTRQGKVVYPHVARNGKLDSYGCHPVTTGGIVIGYWARLEGHQYRVYDQDRKCLGQHGIKSVLLERLAASDHARHAYIDAALDGAFGDQVEAWVRAAHNSTIDGDDAEQNVIIDWPWWGPGGRLVAQVKLDGEFIGLLRLDSISIQSETFFDVMIGTRTEIVGHGRTFDAAVGKLIAVATAIPRCTEATNHHGGVCQAPLNADGSCPGEKLHVTAMHRRDRDDAIREALRQLQKAVEADRLADPDGEHEVREELGAAQGIVKRMANREGVDY